MFKFYRLQRMLMDKAGDGGAGGGGTPPPENKGDKGGDDTAKLLADLKASNDALVARLAKLEGSHKPPEGDDGDLHKKALKQREEDAKKSGDAKALEAALKFSLGSENWIKTNQSLLPKDVPDIFKAAERETYANAIEKDQAIKAGVIQSFFSVQENLDLLTPSLKASLEEYLKLTKNVKQDRAQQIYDSIFEPTFEMKRRLKKADALSKGFGTATDADDAHKQKMMGLSKKHYLKERK